MNKLFALLVKALLGISVVLGGVLASQPASALTDVGTCYQGAIDRYITTYINTNGKSYFAGENNTGAISFGFALVSGPNPWSFSTSTAHTSTYTPTGSNGFYTGSKSLTMRMNSTGGVTCTYTKTFNFYWNMYPQVTPDFTVTVNNARPSFVSDPATITVKATTPSSSVYGPVEGYFTITLNNTVYRGNVISNGNGTITIGKQFENFSLARNWWNESLGGGIDINMYSGFNNATQFIFYSSKGRFASSTKAITSNMPSWSKAAPPANTDPWQEAKDNLGKGWKNINGVSYAGNQTGGCVLSTWSCQASEFLMSDLFSKYNVLDPGYYCGLKPGGCSTGGVNWYDVTAVNDLNYGPKWWAVNSTTIEGEHSSVAVHNYWVIACQVESTSVSVRYFDNGQSSFGNLDALANYNEMRNNRNYRFNITNNVLGMNGNQPIFDGVKPNAYEVSNDTWQSIKGSLWAQTTAGGWACNYPATKFNTTTRFTVPAPQKFSTAHSIYIENLNVTKNGDTGRKIKTGSIAITVKNNDTGATTTNYTSCNLNVACPRQYTIGALSADANGTSYTVTATFIPDAMYENNKIFNGSSYSQSFMVYQSFNCNFSASNGPIKLAYVNPETQAVSAVGGTATSLIRSGELWRIYYPNDTPASPLTRESMNQINRTNNIRTPNITLNSNVGGLISAGPTGKYNVASRLYVYGTPTLPAEVRVFRGSTDNENLGVEQTRQTGLPLIFGQGDTTLTGLIGRWYYGVPTDTGRVTVTGSDSTTWRFLPTTSPNVNEYVSITWPSTIGPNGSRIPMQLVREVAVYGEAFDPWQSLGERPNVGWHSCSNAQNATSWNPAPPTPGGNPQTAPLTIVSGHLTQ